MSNAAAPQCSSGVESGWTLYLDGDDENESFISSEPSRRIPGSHRSEWSRKEEDDDNENLSMVSDASSGPPSYEVEDWSCHVSGGGSVAGSEHGGKKKDKRQQSSGRYSGYEDTACSRKDESRYEKHRHCPKSPVVADQKAASRKAGNSRKLM